ncbi:unnamed protein product [Paramecium primaurelia]|uniref:Uncharacterized protein n=1 Tax=Paramecium primaurelia TaxID=5886 RepID=A0A8S1PFE0_PARPR|nr:unnamed protein product [Paramecium primaurelia]
MQSDNEYIYQKPGQPNIKQNNNSLRYDNRIQSAEPVSRITNQQMPISYQPHQELTKYLKENLSLVNKTVRSFENSISQLLTTFGNNVINGFRVDEFIRKFFCVLERRLNKFFDHLDYTLFQQKIQHQITIPEDYNVPDIRNYIRMKANQIPTDLLNHFQQKLNTDEIDREILRKVDQILRVYELFRSDQAWNFLINITKFNLEQLLENTCNNKLQDIQSIDELLESQFIISIQLIQSAILKNNTNFLNIFNKEDIINKFHQIINDLDDYQIKIDDIQYICQIVCQRDRRIIYNDFHQQITYNLNELAPEYFQILPNKKSQHQLKKEELQNKLINVQKQWELIKLDENYYLILENRINEANLNINQNFSNQQQHIFQLQRLGTFFNRIQNLSSDQISLQKEINNHLDQTKKNVQSKLTDALVKARQFYSKTTPGKNPSNQIKTFVDTLYEELIDLLEKSQSYPNQFNSSLSHTQKSQFGNNSNGSSFQKSANLEKSLQNSSLNRPFSNIQYNGLINPQAKLDNMINWQLEQGQNQDKKQKLNREVYAQPKTDYYNDSFQGKIKNPQYQKLNQNQTSYNKSNSLNDKDYDLIQTKKKEFDNSKAFNPNQSIKSETKYQQTLLNQNNDNRNKINQVLQYDKKYPDNLQKQEYSKDLQKQQIQSLDKKRETEPPKITEIKKEQPLKQEPSKKQDFPKEQLKQPDPPKKTEPPREQPKQPEPPKKPEPPKEQPKQSEPPKKPEPPREQPKQPEPPKKPEPPKEQPKQPEPPKKPEPPKDQPKQPEPPKKPEPPKDQPKQPEPPKKPEPPKEQPKQPEPPKKPEPPKDQPKQPEPPKKPEPPKEQPKQPEPPKKPEPPKEQPKQPEPRKEQPKQPEQFKAQINEDEQKPDMMNKPEQNIQQIKKPDSQLEKIQNQQGQNAKQQNFDEYDINLEDIEDEDDDGIDFMTSYVPSNKNKQTQQKQNEPENKMNQMKQPELSEGDGTEIQIKKLITEKTLPWINKFTKSYKYGAQFQVKDLIYEFNSFDHLIQLFQTFILQDELYFFDFEETDLILEIFEKILAEEDPQNELEQFQAITLQNFQNRTQKQNFSENQKLYYLFDKTDMFPFDFYLIEKDPSQHLLRLYYEDEPSEESMGEQFQNFLSVFQQIFECEEYELDQIVLQPKACQTLKSLKKKDNKYLKALLTLFSHLYEQEGSENINFDEETIARLVWVLHQSNEFFTMFEEQEEDIKELFLDILKQGQQQDPSVEFVIIEQPFNQEGLENLQQDIQMVYQEFLQNKQITQNLISVNVLLEEQQIKINLYCHLQRINNKNILKIFTLNHYSEIGAQIIELLYADDLFEQHIYSEFPRHNIFHECTEITLGAWYFMQTQSKLQPEEAMANLLFSLIPYNLIMTQEE